MGVLRRHARKTLLALLGIGMLALFASPLVSSASADACSDYGNTLPEDLTAGQAGDAIICFINKERGQNLSEDRRLNEAAQRHSNYMRKHTCFSHRCKGEKSIEGRLRAANYIKNGLSRWLYGENLVWGLRDQVTPRNAVQAWMRSPGHKANILNPAFRDIGVGFAHGTRHNRNAPGALITVDFGFRRG